MRQLQEAKDRNWESIRRSLAQPQFPSDIEDIEKEQDHPGHEVTSIDFETTKYDASPHNEDKKDLEIKVDEQS